MVQSVVDLQIEMTILEQLYEGAELRRERAKELHKIIRKWDPTLGTLGEALAIAAYRWKLTVRMDEEDDYVMLARVVCFPSHPRSARESSELAKVMRATVGIKPKKFEKAVLKRGGISRISKAR